MDYIEASLRPEISARFSVVERLGHNVFGDTYLLSENVTKELYVLKYREAEACNEAELLYGLSHIGLPVFEKVVEHRAVLRKYIGGEPLNEFLQDREVTDAQKISLLVQLCDILIYLHSRSIIHRDIKPSNIIITEENTVVLIDFGISRKYRENATADTTFFGTSRFAPPEQYGFAQTDPRSDIYALGMVMRYLFTGSTERNIKITDKKAEKIAAKCLELSPDSRYQNAAALKKALLNYKRGDFHYLIGLSAGVIFIAIIFFANNQMNADNEIPLKSEPNGVIELKNPPVAADEILSVEMLPIIEISDVELMAFAASESFWMPYLWRVGGSSGFPLFEFVENRGLKIHSRQERWHSASFPLTSLLPGEYLVTIELSADVPTNFYLVAAQEPYISLIPGGFINATSVTMEYELTIVNVDGENMAVVYSNGNLYYFNDIIIQTDYSNGDTDTHNDFYIKSFRVYAGG